MSVPRSRVVLASLAGLLLVSVLTGVLLRSTWRDAAVVHTVQGFTTALANGDGWRACSYLSASAARALAHAKGAQDGPDVCVKTLHVAGAALTPAQRTVLRTATTVSGVRIKGSTATATVGAAPVFNSGSKVVLHRENGRWLIEPFT